MALGLFGITDDTLNLVVNLLVLFLVVVWLALIAWTFFDARRRIDDPVLVACATAASLFPFVGTIIYSILRPPEFLDEKQERELEIRAAQLRVRQLEEQSCPNCEHPVERSYLRCPSCRVRIKNPCPSCGQAVDPRWSLCPYCETALRRRAPVERQPATVAGRRTKPKPKPSESSSKRREPEPKQRRPAPKREPQPAASGDAAAEGNSRKSSSSRQKGSSKQRSSSSSSSQRSSSRRSSSSKQRG